jgi:hypothetical protein
MPPHTFKESGRSAPSQRPHERNPNDARLFRDILQAWLTSSLVRFELEECYQATSHT